MSANAEKLLELILAELREIREELETHTRMMEAQDITVDDEDGGNKPWEN